MQFSHNKRVISQDTIPDNKDGGMLVVKTVRCEFASAACNDS